ncbi:cytochrome P450 [Mariluticola halotolerans]|uniref:cytochrome P450 n=1 Tax=Mariluticola halotolerans TaxID=2909283 RepID=UPI0026E3024A|nr:cytochrome P450 [Mariluticola halotolerans]UJQ94862.1 cytochrome P450 [Mariluticola halotolerans]
MVERGDPPPHNTLHEFDADVPETFDSVHEMFRDLRGRCPVAHSADFEGFWVLTKYDDVINTLADADTYSTAIQNVVPRVATSGRRPPLHLDPPDHTPYRRAITPLFRTERMKALEPVVRKIVTDLLAPVVGQGEADICLDFSYKLPIHVLAEFFHIPPEQAEKIRDIGADYNRALQHKDMEKVQATSVFLYEVARDIIELRKVEPLDPTIDPTSALLAARQDGEPLPEEMILGTIRQLLVVGIIAPTTFIGSMTIHFARHPEHHRMLKDDPSLVPAALEEMLRLYTPYRGFARTPKKDVTIRGRTIPKDEPIALSFTSANRDADAFENPDEFRLDRPEGRQHMAFGRGPHQCAGAPLARLMLRVTLEELIARTDGFEITGEIPMTTWPEYGPLSVPVRFL